MNSQDRRWKSTTERGVIPGTDLHVADLVCDGGEVLLLSLRGGGEDVPLLSLHPLRHQQGAPLHPTAWTTHRDDISHMTCVPDI